MKENWRSIYNYEGIYEVSDLGRVRSLDRFNSRGYRRKGNILKQSDNGQGYLRVGLCKENKLSVKKVHQLVAVAFLGHTPCGHKVVVDHIDNDKFNNKLSNLNLTTQRNNCSKDKKGGTSKYVGVSWHTASSRWRAQIKIKGKAKHLGNFTNEVDAHNAYQEALK